jgi:hypothetical protein
MRMGRALALVCLVLHVDACSVLFVTPAPPYAQPGQPVECTDSHVWPWVDTIYGLAMISSAVGGGESSTSSTNKSVGVPVLSLVAAGAILSAYVGFRRVGRCQELEDAYDAARARYPYPPPPPYYAPPPQPLPPPQPIPPPSSPR